MYYDNNNYRFNDEKRHWFIFRVSRDLEEFFYLRVIPIMVVAFILLIMGYPQKYMTALLVILCTYALWDVFRHDNEKAYSLRGNKIYFSYGDFTYSWINISRIKSIEIRENKKRDEYLVLKGFLLNKKIYPQSASYMKQLIEDRKERLGQL